MADSKINLKLSEWIDRFLEEPPNPLAHGEPVAVGTYVLGDNPAFLSELLDFVARGSGKFDTLEEFIRRYQVGSIRPTKPDPDDPSLYRNPPPVPKNSTVYQVYQARIFQKRMREYRKSLGEHSQNERRVAELRSRYTKDPAGYCQYVLDRLPESERRYVESKQVLRIEESRRAQHTYVSGMSGSGKSETLKTILYRYLNSPQKCALVIIDPHGKLAYEVAKWPEAVKDNRLILIDPTLTPDRTPVLNPFDLRDKSPKSVARATQNLLGAFVEILKGDAALTMQMETVLNACISALLLMEESHLGHLQAFMDDEANGPLIDYAIRHDPNAANRKFFDQDIRKSSYSVTKQSIRTKLQSLLTTAPFLNFVVGKSSFDLGSAIESGKLLIFSLSRGTIGPDAGGAMGRLVLAMLQNIAMARAEMTESEIAETTPIHLFVDEFQNFVSPSVERILTETRKYRLHLTFANQFIGQVDDRRIRDAVMGNTGVKISGTQPDLSTLSALSASMRVPVEVIQNLGVGEFLYKIGVHPPLIVQNPDRLLGSNHAMSSEEWGQVVAGQSSRYYREIADTDTMVKRLSSLPGIEEKRPPGETSKPERPPWAVN